MLETIAPLTATVVPQREVAKLLNRALPKNVLKPRSQWILCRILLWCWKG